MVQYPERVFLHESLPRDGFQNVKTFIPTEHKIEIVKKLIDSGMDALEVTSFVSPKAVPQMADAAEVCKAILPYAAGKKIKLTAFAPNRRGIENALASGICHFGSGISASEKHCLENWHKTQQELLDQATALRDEFKGQAIFDTFGISAAFSSPFKEEELTVEQVIRLCEYGFENDFEKISLADTAGDANPKFVREVLETLVMRYGPDKFALHIHDTYGFALLNYHIALELGIAEYSNVVGGLGGCPFAPGAAGNQATEDFLMLCDKLGIRYSADMQKIYEVLQMVEEYVDAPISSHVWSVKKNTPCQL